MVISLPDTILYKMWSPIDKMCIVFQIEMYENHRSIDCVVSPKKLFIPYLVPTYFNILKVSSYYK